MRSTDCAADRDAYSTIAKSSSDPRWAQPSLSIEPDPRSRNYVPENIDRPPMPADDPASHEFMQCIWGMKGYKHWLDNGVTDQLDNPRWREHLGEYVPMNEDGEIILNADTALTLAYMHSPDYQDQLEELYLTAIDVSTERFSFETQFFGRINSRWEHFGRERFGDETNTLDIDSRLEASRQFATAGTLLVGLANRLTWQFAGADTHSNLSLIDFALVQPLLRNGGRTVALERLTRTQRPCWRICAISSSIARASTTPLPWAVVVVVFVDPAAGLAARDSPRLPDREPVGKVASHRPRGSASSISTAAAAEAVLPRPRVSPVAVREMWVASSACCSVGSRFATMNTASAFSNAH